MANITPPPYTRRHIAPMANRILKVYRSATPTEMVEGMGWYADARAFCADTARAHGSTIPTVAGVVAALSPMTEWELNKRRAADCMAGADNVGLNSGKAVAIRDGADPLDVLGGNKVRNFYGAIVEPSGPFVVVDRHAHDIAIGRVLGNEDRKVLERVGMYDLFAEAYRRAASLAGIIPSEMQAITWTVWKNRHTAFGGAVTDDTGKILSLFRFDVDSHRKIG